MKVLKHFLRWLVVVLLGVYLLLLMVANYSPLQQVLTQKVEKALEENLGTDVSIETIDIELFNKLSVKNLSIKDKAHETLLKARLASVKIELMPLFQGRVSLRTVSLLDANVNLYKASADSPTNFQFIVDALSSKEKKESAPLDLRINSIILRRVNVAWHERMVERTPGHFNVHHIDVRNIDASISLKHLTDKAIDARVRSLAFEEASGLQVKKLVMLFHANQREALIERFRLELPSSKLSFNNLHLTYDVRDGHSRFLSSLKVKGALRNANVALADLKPFIELPKAFGETSYNVNAQFEVSPSFINVKQLNINDLRRLFQLSLTARADRTDGYIRHVDCSKLSVVAGPDMLDAVAPLVSKDNKAQRLLPCLGKVHLQANGHYRKAGLSTLHFTLHSAVADMKGEASLQGQELGAKLHVKGLKLAELLNDKQVPTNITASIEGGLTLPSSQEKNGKCSLSTWLKAANAKVHLAEANYQRSTFKDITLTADARDALLRFDLKSAAEALRGNVKGQIMLAGAQPHHLDVKAQINHFKPSAIGLNMGAEGVSYKGYVEVRLPDFDFSKLAGEVRLTNFSQANGKYGNFALNELTLKAEAPQASRGTLSLHSDFADATYQGDMQPKVVVATVKKMVEEAVPGLLSDAVLGSKEAADAELSLKLRETDFWERMLGVGLHLEGPLTLHALVRPSSERATLTASTDGFAIDNQRFEAVRLYFALRNKSLKSLTQFKHALGKTNLLAALSLKGESGTLRSDLSWRDNQTERYTGSFSALTRFDKRKHGSEPLGFTTDIRPTAFSIGDSLWQVASGHLRLNNSHLFIDNFSLSHAQQKLAIDGELSPQNNDSIVARLHDIDIAFIMNLLNFHPIEFGGMATGEGIVKLDRRGFSFNAQLEVPDFQLNNALMGHTTIEGDFDETIGDINLNAKMKRGGETSTIVGYVSPKKKGLSLYITPSNLNLAFLDAYVGDIFTDIEGSAKSGHCLLYGPFNHLDFKGEVKAEAKAKLPFTGATYALDDGDVQISPGLFHFRNFTIKNEKSRGSGTISGTLRHDGLKNLRYNFDAKVNNLLAYDLPKNVSLPFFSTAYGTGSININGSPGILTANIAMAPEAGTDFTYVVDAPSSFADEGLLRIAPRRVAATEQADTLSKAETLQASSPILPGTDIYLNFMFDMNPRATLRVVTNEKAGDNITLRGNGPLRATFYNKGAFQMFGTYEVTDGKYRMSIQDFIRKDMTIQNGSNVVFAGDPFNADLNLKAVYVVNAASLADLNYGAGFSKGTVRVDCILNIGGKTGAPTVNFDLDLRGVSEDEKQMVRSLIATDESMNRQVIYLLGVGRFYTENFSETPVAASQSQTNVAMKSFLSSTISSQLNEMISSAMGAAGANWTFGTNLSTGQMGWSDMEVDGLLQGRLFGDRLLINGNFGYRERSAFSPGQSNFVGDFDIRYLLTPKGNISVKAYSETNDRYFTKSSLTTQGVGLMFQHDFSNFKDLFTLKKKKKTDK